MSHPDIMDNPRALSVDVVRVNRVNVRLLSCDHRPYRMPNEDPWSVIDENIRQSSVVFLEYFPHELKSTVFNNRFVGKEAKELSVSSGIAPFFERASLLTAQHSKEIAVADIANKLAFSIYDGPIRLVTGLTVFAAGSVYASLDTGILGSGVATLGIAFFVTHVWLGGLKLAELGIASLQMGGYEKFILDITDARRVETARGIEEEAIKTKEESNILYIAPHAHVSRVKWYLENRNNPLVKAKRILYFCLPGLDHFTRSYRFSTEAQVWQSVN